MPHQNQQGVDLGQTPDISEREDEGTVVEILDVNHEPMFFSKNGEQRPVTITVAGTYSNRYRRVEEAQQTRRIKRRMRNLDGHQLNKEHRELVAACVLDWEGFYDDGEPLEPTRENVRRVLQALPFVQEQVEQAMEDHEAFFRNSSSD